MLTYTAVAGEYITGFTFSYMSMLGWIDANSGVLGTDI